MNQPGITLTVLDIVKLSFRTSYFSHPHNTCVDFHFIIVMETLINPVLYYSYLFQIGFG